MANSIDDVISQMREVGLDAPRNLESAFSKYVRWRPADEKKVKKSAWVRLYDYTSPTTQKRYITGAYGWRGDVYEVRASDKDWSPAERSAALEERKAAQKLADQQRQQDAESAAKKAQGLWAKAREPENGPPHPYLERKQVGAFGVRIGYSNTLYIPLRDTQGEFQGLQYISADGKDKKFGTGVIKEGRFHVIAEVLPDQPIAFAEGYVTGATGHMATGWPVVVCFDAGNLEAVISAWRKLYPDHVFVILADDDRHLVQRLCDRLHTRHGIMATPAELKQLGTHEWTLPDSTEVELKAGWAKDSNGVLRIEGSINAAGTTHMLKIENAGRAKATACAKKHKAIALFPRFQDDADPGTDWNDLHVQIGLPAAREQLLAAYSAPPEEGKKRATASPAGGGKKEKADVVNLSFIERFTLIYGTTTVWDHQEKMIVKLEALKAAYGKSIEWWQGSEHRQMVLPQNVVFDPSGKVAKQGTHVNLFEPLEMQPNPEGRCDLIVEHLNNLCGNDEDLFRWVACWLALPLQRLGTKMRTSLIIHGRMEGTGKSLMMDIMREIYGRYSRSITQVQLQSEFNGWQSGMLFCVAEEVVSASERKNLKNLIQNLITNPVVQINEKNMPVREEKSFCNFSFLSNEQLPMLLNETDRRYTVIQVEQRHDPAYFIAIGEQMQNGGVGAFLQWLLEYDLKDFNEFTLPFDTKARLHLITLGMAPDQRFVRYWTSGLADLPFCTCTARDLYTGFKAWCRINGERYVANSTQFGRTVSESLERMGVPPKKAVRFDAYSATNVDKGDFSGTTIPQQAVVYFVHAAIQRLVVTGGEPEEGTKTEDSLASEVFNKRIKTFQGKLSELIAQARHAF